MAKKLIFEVEVHEPVAEPDVDYEQEVLEILFTIFNASVSLLDYSVTNISMSRIEEV